MSRHENGQKQSSISTVAYELLAGGLAGGISRTAVAPAERLKILMQVQGNEGAYKNVWQGFLRMARDEGIRGMFKGNGINCLRIVPNSAVKFYTYGQFTSLLSQYQKQRTGDGELDVLQRLGAGAGAGIIAMSSTYPLEMIRGRISIQESGTQIYRGMWHAFTDITRKEGPLTLYRGMLPSVIGAIPYTGCNFAVYETLKVQMVRSYGLECERELSGTAKLSAGSLAGVIGQTICYPFDVVRRRLQVSGWQGSVPIHAGSHGEVIAYKGMTDCFVRICREEGWTALFKGLIPNYLKVIPSIALAFVVYETIMDQVK